MKKKTKKVIRDSKESIEYLRNLVDNYEKSYTYQEVGLLKEALSNADKRNTVSIKTIDDLHEQVNKCNKSEVAKMALSKKAISNLENKIQKLSVEISTRRSALENANRRMFELTTQVSDLEKSKSGLEHLNKQSEKFEESLINVRTDNKNMLSQIDRHCQTIKKQNKDIISLKKRNQAQGLYIKEITWWKLLIGIQ